MGLEKPAYELEQKIKEYFGSYRCLLQEEPAVQRPSRKNNRDDRAFIDFDRTIFTERPTTSQQGNVGGTRPSQNNYEREVFADDYNNNNRQQGNRSPQNSYDRQDGFSRPQGNQERDYIRPSSQTSGSDIGSANNNRRPSVSTQSQNDQRNPYDQYESQNNRNTPDPDPIYFPSNDNRNEQQAYNTNTNTHQNRPNSQTNQTPYYPQSNRDLTTISTTRRTTQSSSRRPEQAHISVTPTRSRPGSISQSQPNRPISSSQSQQSIQTSVNPAYRTTISQSRTTTQPTHNYYEYSRIN